MILAQHHHIIRSILTLKRHCSELGLFRRKQHSDLDDGDGFYVSGTTTQWTDVRISLVTSTANSNDICGRGGRGWL